jgi:general secretion pathway protein G
MTMKNQRGFTMLELMAVLAILATLAWMVMPLAEVARERERERELRRALWEIRDAIDAYQRVYDAHTNVKMSGISGYPPSLATLAEGIPDPASAGQMLYFIRRIPRDPFASATLPPEQTWGLRSYDSSASEPAAGADVYDVYSRSTAMALDGTLVKSW